MSSEVRVFTDGTYVGRAQGVDFKSGSGITVSGARDPANSQIDLTVTAGGTAADTDLDVRYVAGTGAGLTGSDSNDGLTIGAPYATIQAAYDSLPAEGGTLILLNGTHSVGTGFVGVGIKPALFTSLPGQPHAPGYFPSYTSQGTSPAQAPTITGTGATLFSIPTNAVNQARGWAFRGLNFDMRAAANRSGIYAVDQNFLQVHDCNMEGNSNSDCFLVRTDFTVVATDTSWHRIENNNVRLGGICSLNDSQANGNCNNNQIINNVCFGAVKSIKMACAQRCLIMGNELSDGGIVLTNQSRYNQIVFNQGEGTAEPFISYDATSYSNVHFNWGLHGSGGDGTQINVSDLAIAEAAAFGSTHFDRATAYVHGEETDNFTLGTNEWHNGTKNVTKATAVTATINAHSATPMSIGTNIRIRQGGLGQVTIAPGAGVTLQSLTGGLKTKGQYAVIYLQKIAVNTWAVWGDTTTETTSTVYPPGYQFSYNEITTNATSTQTTEASADTIITASTVTYDGTTPVRVVFSANGMGNNTNGTGTSATLWRKDGAAAAAQIARMAIVLETAGSNSGFSPVHAEYFDTPTAAATIYYAKLYVTGASTGTVLCSSPYRPAYLRVVRA